VRSLTVISPPCLEAVPNTTGFGAGLCKAADALAAAGLPAKVRDLGAPVAGVHKPRLPDEAISGDPVVDLGWFNRCVADLVAAALADGSAPLLAGGSCNHLPGMIAGIQRAIGVEKRIGLLWLDAHGDFNTPATTPSGMLGGMPVAVTAGLCHPAWREGAGLIAPLPTNQIMMVDVRNLDPDEERLIRATDVEIVRFGERGADDVVDTVLRFGEQVDVLYVHIDVDILDASLQPNHPTVEPDGLDVAQTLSVVQAAMAPGTTVAFGVVSINPEEPKGEIAMASAMELLLGGVERWVLAGSPV
jgi:arginase